VARFEGGGWRFAERDSFAGTILADAGVRQARSLDDADLVLASRVPVGVDGSFQRVEDATWWGPGGIHAARAALADLQQILQ
jgi:hypothetical protein